MVRRQATAGIRYLDRVIFGRFRNHYRSLLAEEIGACQEVLDLGCGSDSPLRPMMERTRTRWRTTGVDIHEADLRLSRQREIHDRYILLDVTTLGRAFKPASFDCVLASDLIEHLGKQEGAQLLEDMEAVARKRVMVFTPNGFLTQEPDDNPWQAHRSGWTVTEFRQLGYRVYGVNGWKPLRSEFAAIRFRPQRLWERISFLTQPLTERFPSWAFQLLAVKDVS